MHVDRWTDGPTEGKTDSSLRNQIELKKMKTFFMPFLAAASVSIALSVWTGPQRQFEKLEEAAVQRLSVSYL